MLCRAAPAVPRKLAHALRAARMARAAPVLPAQQATAVQRPECVAFACALVSASAWHACTLHHATHAQLKAASVAGVVQQAGGGACAHAACQRLGHVATEAAAEAMPGSMASRSEDAAGGQVCVSWCSCQGTASSHCGHVLSTACTIHDCGNNKCILLMFIRLRLQGQSSQDKTTAAAERCV